MKELIVWVDVETSGINAESDCLLEIGALVTDLKGEPVGTSYDSLFSIENLPAIIEKSSPTVKEMHDKSLLWSDLWKKKTKDFHVVDCEMVQWLSNIVGDNTIVYFGGNSISLDRNFVEHFLPMFYNLISYRSIDVTSISLMLQSNFRMGGFDKMNKHRALSDIKESVAEYRHYVKMMSEKTFL